MTGAEKIKRKILEDAQKAAEKNLEEARDEVKKIESQLESDIKSKRNEILSKADDKSAEVIKRMVAVAKLEGRKKLLQTKQKLINEAFDKAMEAVINMPDAEYQKLLENMAVCASEDGTGEILLSARDKKRINKDFISNIAKKLAQKGKTPKIRLSDEEAQIQGGFMLRKDKIEINQSFEIIFAMKRGELERDVANILFSEQRDS